MITQSFLTEIAVYGVLASLAGATLILMSLLLLLKRDCQRKLAAMAHSLESVKEEARRGLQDLEVQLEERLSGPLQQAEPDATNPAVPVAPLVQEVTTKRRSMPEVRTEVMEMNGDGLDASSIAARLSMRENEVRLLLKVQNTLRCCVPQVD